MRWWKGRKSRNRRNFPPRQIIMLDVTRGCDAGQSEKIKKKHHHRQKRICQFSVVDGNWNCNLNAVGNDGFCYVCHNWSRYHEWWLIRLTIEFRSNEFWIMIQLDVPTNNNNRGTRNLRFCRVQQVANLSTLVFGSFRQRSSTSTLDQHRKTISFSMKTFFFQFKRFIFLIFLILKFKLFSSRYRIICFASPFAQCLTLIKDKAVEINSVEWFFFSVRKFSSCVIFFGCTFIYVSIAVGLDGCSGECFDCFFRFFSFLRFFLSLSSSWRLLFLCFFSLVSPVCSLANKSCVKLLSYLCFLSFFLCFLVGVVLRIRYLSGSCKYDKWDVIFHFYEHYGRPTYRYIRM